LKQRLARAAADRENGVPLERVPAEMRCPRCADLVGLPEANLTTMRPRLSSWEAFLL
jgi:hypothetical protein